MAPGSTDRRPAIAIAITGASGALYATRTVAALLARGIHVELIVTDYGRRLLRDELGDQASVESLRPYLIGKLMRQAKHDDALQFVSPQQMADLWPSIERYLGKSRPFWTWLLEQWEHLGYVRR